ncbi:hypothetical protein CGRA01v4_12824 [Colletotrichum graminicola]|uniref:BRCT domain-containing protein n=1 Tax=Colletotrichum graminicola (strain M1.001 / M2 / FGSC 10212) TaxID=645133 RepID=E3QIT6_COLGM|nr:uncharacterized protein GLRG_05918 [Colletotrichum graminicola M1.001]EFQ30774.1 hypothetical protein GLRG_05918 [Colletotrichum graminicola M1.001]WDK21534.1 hypothetical protein CGRA01v4_12824 [Colletotrichum graminicola]
MEPQSPPKRITRSRAAKAGETTTSTKPTRVVTAAAKAKSSATAPTRSTSAKRKTRADDGEDEEHDGQSQQSETAARPTRATRGRPKKVTEEPAEPAASSSSSGAAGKATRARAATRKVSTTEPAVPKEEPVKPTRGRPRKTATADAPAKEEEPVKKTTTTRTRTASVTTAKPAVKKTVTFQEPEKENIAPDASKKTTEKPTTGTGLRGRPVRKPPVPKAPRIIKTPAAATSASKPEKTPLSPKKVTQVSMPRDCSDDELAGPDTPPRPMMKSPVKPPASALASSKNVNLLPLDKAPETRNAEDDENSTKSEAQEDEVTNTLASPAKRLPTSPYRDTMKSPAKRAEGVSLTKLASSMNPSAEDGSASPLKASLLHSPAKRPQSAMKAFTLPPANEGERKISNFKASLLQSPAKRPLSPIKGMNMKPSEVSEQTQPPATKSLLLSTPTALRPVKRSSEKLMAEESNAHDDDGDEELDEVAEAMLNESIHLEEPMQFPGRLSAVLPRHADPVLKKNMPVFEAAKEQAQQMKQDTYSQPTGLVLESDVFTDNNLADDAEFDGEPMMVDEESFFKSQPQEATQATFNAPSGLFGLRQKDMDPYNNMDSDSDDELANSPRVSAAHKLIPATPTPAKSRISNVGFTPLAQQLNAWSAASPVKTPRRAVTPGRSLARAPEGLTPAAGSPRVEESPLRSTYFEDEMTVRADMDAQNEIEAAIDAEIEAAADAEDPEFDDLMVTDEDMALAAEANEMSLLEPEELDEIVNTSNSFDDTLSEASQEYGDENEMPVDPAMFNSDTSVPPTTPNRIIAREFHTVSKVPLKASDESTPRPKKKRAASISRLSASRPSLNRSATVISYSPSRKHKAEEGQEQEDEEESEENQPDFAPVTPAKSDVWSSLGTPARTPRRDLNPRLLRGAVVFVDVHTTEGADASGIFVELLTQMGARCVKTWTWNPSATSSSDAAKIGITHVVFKDGGKRTMEKVRESNGVVQCVGVSWVLDCERENEWLDETPYYIDTSLVPRGGARRRKSMEPRALANQNGMLVPTPVKAGREARTAPNTPMNRRDSTVWMHTPSDEAEDDDDDWQGLISPVPATPAPEALARYAAETPSGSTEYDSSPTKALLMQTCPPKPNNYAQMGDGILNRDKDESVMQRLMAARRKSLQFAPKVGSPLAKAWK